MLKLFSKLSYAAYMCYVETFHVQYNTLYFPRITFFIRNKCWKIPHDAHANVELFFLIKSAEDIIKT